MPQQVRCNSMTVQVNDDAHDLSRVDIAELTWGPGITGLELTGYFLREDGEEADEPADNLFLTWSAMAEVFRYYALRHPAEAEHLLTAALGWQGERGGTRPMITPPASPTVSTLLDQVLEALDTARRPQPASHPFHRAAFAVQDARYWLRQTRYALPVCRLPEEQGQFTDDERPRCLAREEA